MIRLLGVRVDHLSDKSQKQLSLFDKTNSDKQEKLDLTLDKLKEKYGAGFITRGGKMQIDSKIQYKDD